MRKLSIRSLLIIAVLVGLTWPAGAANWPRFRGPNGTGIAADKDIPVQWSEGNGILWKVPLPGLGNSSPIIWGDRMYVQSASADAKERYLLCLNTADGHIIWKRSVPGAKATTHQKNTLASSTPATEGERIYTLFWDGNEVGLYAFDLAGNMVWQTPLGKFTSQHGAGASPMVYQDKVFLMNDQDGAAEIISLESKTGKVVWRASRKPFRACYSTPFLLQKGDQPAELIVASTAGITSYQPHTGQENWNWNWTTFTNMALRTVGSPVYSQGMIFAPSGDGGGARHLVAIKAEGKGDITATPPVWEWKKARPFPYVPCLIPWGDHLYFVNDRGDAGCAVAKTGEIVWLKEQISGSITSSPILIDGKVYAVSEDGNAFVFAAKPTFELLGKSTFGEDVRSTPAVADGRLYYRGKNHLFCIGKK